MKKMEADHDCTLDSIKQNGIIKKVDDHTYYISIATHTACSSCHAKSMCNIGSLKEEIIEVPKDKKPGLSVGDRVEVVMEKTLGTKAVMLGYLYPFLLLLLTLILTTSLMNNDGLAALLSLAVLVPYYFILYKMRDHLKKTFLFRLG